MPSLDHLDQHCPVCGGNHSNRDHRVEAHNPQLSTLVFKANAPEMIQALKFKYPCGITGYELDRLPLDYCDKCPINTSDCVDYFASGGYLAEFGAWNPTAKSLGFDEYVKAKRAGYAAISEREVLNGLCYEKSRLFFNQEKSE